MTRSIFSKLSIFLVSVFILCFTATSYSHPASALSKSSTHTSVTPAIILTINCPMENFEITINGNVLELSADLYLLDGMNHFANPVVEVTSSGIEYCPFVFLKEKNTEKYYFVVSFDLDSFDEQFILIMLNNRMNPSYCRGTTHFFTINKLKHELLKN